jgi:hypothetical protein
MKALRLGLLFTIPLLSLPLLQFEFFRRHDFQPDPRNAQRVAQLREIRESLSFQRELSTARTQHFFFPGLKALQLSLTWLEVLDGLHNPASINTDYSWLFSKLHTFAVYSHKFEQKRALAVTPFLFVVGRDPIGSSILMNELIYRSQHYFTPWFWGAYHALENLKDKQMASEMFYQASKRPGSPPYSASLALKLNERKLSSLGEIEKRDFLEKLSPEVRRRIHQQ